MAAPLLSAVRDLASDDLLALHLERDGDRLRERARELLARIAPGTGLAVLRNEDQPGRVRVELALGDCPLAEDAAVDVDAWRPPGATALPLLYRGSTLGELRVAEAPASALDRLGEAAAHLGVALANVELGADAVRSSDLYFASLQAFEEGVVLLQEQDREAVSARFLSLVTSVLGAPHGAVYLFEEPGNPDSPLRLDQALGVPEFMLDALCLPDGTWWPPDAAKAPPQALARDANGTLPVLDGARVPAAMNSVVTSPLAFHDLIEGVALVFNCDTDSPTFGIKLESVRRLGELGAAIFHRIRLEEVAVRSQEVETQLAIAARIQTQLLPTAAPSAPGAEFAWRSEPAQKIGGDYLDLLTDDDSDGDGHVFAVIADVSGHGINSALLMTSFRATYRSECFRRRPDALLAKLNAEVSHEAGDTGMFVTAATFRLSADGRRAAYASAGHNAVLLWRAAAQRLERLESTGPSMGFFADAEFECAEVALEKGDVLLLYTDGVVEAKSPGSETDMFGDERLHACLERAAAKGAAEVLDAVLTSLGEFTGGARCDDDVSVSVIKIR